MLFRSPRFSNVPAPIFDLIFQCLTGDTRKCLAPTLQSAQDTVNKISASCLIRDFHNYKGFFRKHSAISRELVTNLEGIVNSGTKITVQIQQATKTFVEKIQGKRPRTLGLLYKYKLLDLPVNINSEESKLESRYQKK